MLECTVCFEAILEGPIFQCGEGHMLCQSCWNRIYQPSAGCPTCAGSKFSSRAGPMLFSELVFLQVRSAVSGADLQRRYDVKSRFPKPFQR